jgi:hypothetical protein
MLAEDQFGRPLQFTLGTADEPIQINIPAGDAIGSAYLGVQNILGQGLATPEQLWAGMGVDPANAGVFTNVIRVRWGEAMAAAFGDQSIAAQIFENQLQVDAAAAGEQQATAGTGEDFDLMQTPEGVATWLGQQAGMTPQEIFDRIYPAGSVDADLEDAEFFLDPTLGNQPFGF